MSQITLKTLPQATAQEVFDQAVTHLLTQNKKAESESNQCKYLTTDGLKCAAGCFIADDEYKKVFEGKVWEDLIDEVEYGFPLEHSRLIGELQCIHDYYTPSEWHMKLEELATEMELQFNPPIK